MGILTAFVASAWITLAWMRIFDEGTSRWRRSPQSQKCSAAGGPAVMGFEALSTGDFASLPFGRFRRGSLYEIALVKRRIMRNLLRDLKFLKGTFVSDCADIDSIST